MDDNSAIRFITKKCSSMTDKELFMASDLYSNHYGIWNQNGRHPGKRIRMTPEMYQQMVNNQDAYVSLAFDAGTIVGQAFFITKDLDSNRRCNWVTQLVVHTDYRNLEIGKRLLFSVWGFSNDLMWGLATTNPMTIKTLESVTLRKVSINELKKHEKLILTLKQFVPYFSDKEVCISDTNAVIKSDFHADTASLVDSIKKYGDDWPFSNQIESGDEWLGFVFNDQPFRKLNKKELDKYFDYPIETIKNAYSRMDMDHQKWASTDFAQKEINTIRRFLSVNKDSPIADFGCGTGRHSFALAKEGYCNIVGIDFSKEHISKAKEQCKHLLRDKISFVVGDCRTYKSSQQFDFILCAYDVIGSLPTPEDNQDIVNNIYQNLSSGGTSVVSVMNYDNIINRFKKKGITDYFVDITKNPEALFNLKSSNKMQKTGEIFDPQYIRIDSKTKVVYRKERFKDEEHLNTEYIIRDYRYTKDELINMFVRAGFKKKNCYCRYVSAGRWDANYKSTDTHAKEILLIARKE